MIGKHDKLPDLMNVYRETPLLKAVRAGHKVMARYLFPLTNIDQLHVEDHNTLFVATVKSEMYDIALQMLEIYQIDMEWKPTALQMLARKPQEIASGSGVETMIRYICSCFKGICREASMPTLAYQLVEKIWMQVLNLEDEEILQLIRENPMVLFDAVKFGNVKFLTMVLNTFPNLIWDVRHEGERLFHVAISHRQEKIFNLIYNSGAFMDEMEVYNDQDCNNILHLASKLPERLGTSRPNLQMHRELLWFKKMEKIMSPEFSKKKNDMGLTPKDLFWKEHEELINLARTAMMETANSCMLVATLIATIVFAAALVIPGSSNGAKGVWYKIFVASNAVALFSSSTSIIMLLSILTSRFIEIEYVTSLRAKMMCGLTALFISITSMVIAFTAAVFLIFDYKSTWVPYFTASLASVPVIMFLLLHHKLGMGRI